MNRRTGSLVNRRIAVLVVVLVVGVSLAGHGAVFAGVAFIESKSDQSAGRQSEGAVQRRHSLREYAVHIGTHWH